MHEGRGRHVEGGSANDMEQRLMTEGAGVYRHFIGQTCVVTAANPRAMHVTWRSAPQKSGRAEAGAAVLRGTAICSSPEEAPHGECAGCCPWRGRRVANGPLRRNRGSSGGVGRGCQGAGRGRGLTAT